MDLIWFRCSDGVCDLMTRLRLEMRVPHGDLPVLGLCPACRVSLLVLGGRVKLQSEADCRALDEHEASG